MSILSPYGSWKSPISADLVASSEIGLEQMRIDGGDIYWIERRAQEGGRKVIVRRVKDSKVTDLTPAGFNARTRVHEYGGGDYAVANETVIFSNFTDQRLYRQELSGEPKALTAQAPLRYADGQIDRRRNLFFCVREDHSAGGEAVNTIVRIDLATGADAIVVSGYDFYSSPRLSPDGSRLAWLTWNHPNMPWDGTELWVGTIGDEGSVTVKEKIAGGVDESICQPEWSPNGVLYFISDRTGWWNLYRWRENHIEPLCPMAAEFGQPQWVFGTSLYGFATERKIVCSYSRNGRDYLAALDIDRRSLDAIDLPFSAISQVRVAGDRVCFIGASSTEATSIVSLDLATRQFQILRRSRETSLPSDYLAEPTSNGFPTEHRWETYKRS